MGLSVLKPLVILKLFCLFAYVNSLSYLVHHIEEPTSIEQNEPTTKQPVDIYCYSGTSKNLFALWQTAKFQIKTENDTFNVFMNDDPEKVYEDYENSRFYILSSINYLDMTYDTTLSLRVFKQTCMTINVQGRYSVYLLVQRINYWRALSMCVGIELIFAAKSLSSSPTFYYLCGVTAGVFSSYMFCVITLFIYYGGIEILVFILFPILLYVFWNRLSNEGDIFPAGVICIGISILLLQQIWLRIQYILYTPITLSYTMAISLIVCRNFQIPPPLYKRNRTLVMVALQVLGVLLVFFSSDYEEAVAAIIQISLCTTYWCGRHTYVRINPGRHRGYMQGWRRYVVTQSPM